MKEPIVIVGTGAMACLFAARLAESGLSVIMLGTWPEGLAALQAEGVRLLAADGSQRSFAVRATDDPGACRGIRQAIVLVKSWQTARAAAQLSHILPPDGVALSLQNGLGNQEELVNALGDERVALGVTTAGATLIAPGVVQPGGTGVISLGPHPLSSSLHEVLQQAGFNVAVVSDLERVLWGKLIVNAAINPITALLRAPNGQLLARAAAYELMRAAAIEAATVAAALGIRLPYADAAAAAAAVAESTAANHSSMLQDVQRGAPTEIDAICGAIVRAGKDAGIPTPINHTLYQLITALLPPPQVSP